MPKIIGNGAPTSSTPAVLGQEYFDKDSKQVYTCINVTHKQTSITGEMDVETEWAILGGSGGSGGAVEPYIVSVMSIGYNPYIENPDEVVKAFLDNRTLMVYVAAAAGEQYGGSYYMVARVGIYNVNTSDGPGDWRLDLDFRYDTDVDGIEFVKVTASISDPTLL